MIKRLMIIFMLFVALDVSANELCYVTFQSDEIKTVEVECGQTIQPIILSTQEEQTFLGWYYENEIFNFDTLITSDIILQARWNDDKIDSNEGINENLDDIIKEDKTGNFYYDMSEMGREIFLISFIVVAGIIQLVVIPKIKKIKTERKIKNKI